MQATNKPALNQWPQLPLCVWHGILGSADSNRNVLKALTARWSTFHLEPLSYPTGPTRAGPCASSDKTGIPTRAERKFYFLAR